MGTNRRITVELPSGWSDESIYFFRGPEQAGMAHSLSVLVDENPGTTDVDSYARDRVLMLQASQSGLEVLKEGAITMDDGREAYEMVYKVAGSGPRPEFGRQVFMLQGGTAYAFQGKYTKPTARTLGAAIDQMIRSFHIEE